MSKILSVEDQRTAVITKLAVEVFGGNKEEAAEWLENPQSCLVPDDLNLVAQGKVSTIPSIEARRSSEGFKRVFAALTPL